MADSELSLEQLPYLDEAVKFPKSKFNAIAREFMNYSFYCDNMFVPDKMREWCTYLGCAGEVCSYDFGGVVASTSPVIVTLVLFFDVFIYLGFAW